MVLPRIITHHDGIYKYPRNCHVLWIQGPRLGYMLDLGNHLPAIPFGCQHCRKDFQFHSFLRGGQITHLIADSAPDDAYVNGDLPVKHILFSPVLHNINDILQRFCPVIHLTALISGINEGSKPHFGHLTGKATGHAVIELSNLPLGKAVCLHLVASNHFHPPGLKSPV